MSDDEITEGNIRDADPHDGPRELLQDAEAKHVAFFAWIGTAVAYGYFYGRWPEIEVLPDIALVMGGFGLCLGIAFSATFAHATNGDSE